MAAPPEVTTHVLTGVYTMNKTLSDTSAADKILTLQGVGWMKRKVIANATVTLYVKHYKDDAGVEHIDIDQTLTGGIPGTTEKRILDWDDRAHEDHLFGAVVGKSRRTKVEDIEQEFLKEGWLQDTVEHGAVESYVVSDTPKSKTSWTAHQIWGFKEIDGVRRYSRSVKFTGPKGENVEAHLWYDYYGPNNS